MAVIRGTASADTLNGTAAADSLTGLAGNDRLIGRGGDDALNGGAGADRLDGGAGNDTAGYGNETAAIRVDLALGTVVTSTGTDTLSGVENVAGSRFADTFVGNAEANIFRGRGGNDTFRASAGADRYDGGSGTDLVTYTDLASTVAVDLRRGTGTSGLGSHQFVAVEDIDGGNRGDRLFGSDGANTLFGDAGDDDLRGRGGNDVLLGGDGADRVSGGGGNDVLDGGNDDDVLSVGAGSDLVRYLVDSDEAIDTLGGNDLILDFSRADDVLAAQISFLRTDGLLVSQSGDALFARLDSNANGRLDNGDAAVAVQNVTVDGQTARSTIIDFGLATNASSGQTLFDANTHTVTLFGVTGMVRGDFFDVAALG